MFNTIKSQKEKLDKIYVCTTCNMVFLFRSDVEEHEVALQHGKMHEIPLN